MWTWRALLPLAWQVWGKVSMDNFNVTFQGHCRGLIQWPVRVFMVSWYSGKYICIAKHLLLFYIYLLPAGILFILTAALATRERLSYLTVFGQRLPPLRVILQFHISVLWQATTSKELVLMLQPSKAAPFQDFTHTRQQSHWFKGNYSGVQTCYSQEPGSSMYPCRT